MPVVSNLPHFLRRTSLPRRQAAALLWQEARYHVAWVARQTTEGRRTEEGRLNRPEFAEKIKAQAEA